MKTHETELELIKDLLRNNPKGMKISRIAGVLALNRNAVAKFLEILLMTGQVELIEHGMSKIFILSRRTSIPTMLDHSADSIVVLDKDTRITQVNDNFLRLSGKKREDTIGKRADTIGFPVISQKAVSDKIREAQFGADIRTNAREILHGDEFFFEVRMTHTIFNDGKRGITVVMRDITQERLNEMLLRESEENFRTLFGESLVGTAVFDATGNLLNVNPAFLVAFGGTNRDGLDFRNLFSVKGVPAGAQETLDTGKNVKFEVEIDRIGEENPGSSSRCDPDKTRFGLQITPVNLANRGRQTGYLVQVHENRNRNANSASDDRALLEEILSCVDEAVILMDFPTASISFVNRTAENVFGYSKGEFLKKDLSVVLGYPGSINEYLGTLSRTFQSRGYFESESMLKRCAGRDFPAKVHLRPIRNTKGEIRNIVVVITDMSGRNAVDAHPIRSEALFRFPGAASGAFHGPDGQRNGI